MRSDTFGWLLGAALASAGFAAPQAMQVPIDVKPGDTPTTIEKDRGGHLPVAILSTAQFDALTVDPSTIRVGPTGTEAEPARTTQGDVNDDKRVDLQVLVRVRDLGIACNTKAIRVTAKTISGAAIEGSEAVTVNGCTGR
jgi:hypothetical protein